MELQEFIKLNRLTERTVVLVIVFEDWNELTIGNPYKHDKSYNCQWYRISDPYYMGRTSSSYITQQLWWDKVAEREVMCFGAACNSLGSPMLWVKVDGEYPGDVD